VYCVESENAFRKNMLSPSSGREESQARNQYEAGGKQSSGSCLMVAPYWLMSVGFQ
jgi:hypothetical protein